MELQVQSCGFCSPGQAAHLSSWSALIFASGRLSPQLFTQLATTLFSKDSVKSLYSLVAKEPKSIEEGGEGGSRDKGQGDLLFTNSLGVF